LTAIIPTNPTTLVPPSILPQPAPPPLPPRPAETGLPTGKLGPAPTNPGARDPFASWGEQAPAPTIDQILGPPDLSQPGPDEAVTAPAQEQPVVTPPPVAEQPIDPWAAPPDDLWAPHSTGQLAPGISDFLNDPYSAANPDDIAAQLYKLSQTDPAKYAQVVAQHQASVEQQAHAAQIEARHAKLKEMETDLAVNNARVNAAHQAMTDVANTPPVNAWADASFGTKVAGYLTAAMGGLMQGYALTKGVQMQNPGIAAIAKLMDDSLAEQRAQLGRKTNALSSLIATYGDQYKAEQALKVAQLNEIVSNIDQYRTQVDPRGTQAMNALQMRQGFEAMRAKAIQDAGDHAAKQAGDVAKTNLDIANTEKVKAETASTLSKLLKSTMGGGAGGIASTGGNPDDAFILALPKAQQDNAVKVPGGGVVIVPNPTMHTEVSKKLGGARNVTDHIDQTLILMQNSPSLADKLKSKLALTPGDVRVLQQEIQQLAFGAKDTYGLGQIQGGDLQMLSTLGADPDSVTKFGLTGEQLQAILRNWRAGISRDANNLIKQNGLVVRGTGQVDFGKAPTGPEVKPVSKLTSILAAPPSFDPKTGMANVPTGAVLTDYVNQLDHQRVVESLSPEKWTQTLDSVEHGFRSNVSRLDTAIKAAEDEVWKASGIKAPPTPEQRAGLGDNPKVANLREAKKQYEQALAAVHFKQQRKGQPDATLGTAGDAANVISGVPLGAPDEAAPAAAGASKAATSAAGWAEGF
jgi:hypothetical protein